jgi:hypothetical protein
MKSRRPPTKRRHRGSIRTQRRVRYVADGLAAALLTRRCAIMSHWSENFSASELGRR